MLKLRILTAVVALAILLAVLFVAPPALVNIAIAAVVIGGAWEWSGFLGLNAVFSRVAYTLTIAGLIAFIHFGGADLTRIVLVGAFVWWLFAGLWVILYPTPVATILKWVGGVFVLLPLFVAMLELYARGADYLLFLLLIVWSADVGAYFAGKQFGKVKLKPSISPGKTWEGVLGGLAFSTIIAVSGAVWFAGDLMVIVPFCFAIAIISIIGDLTVSIFKRSAGVKDSGTLFPGHGGILDRVDSVAAASPLFALGLIWIGVL